ncbi:hypothetical protein [Aneurinibacillus aneurinilyticus]|uniref:hypothetical protein n=1 Tax=Aneurinibacillus aneurinilyticus TaxID=1391 RepID=UPI0023F239E5|nr:hypothetical protein [Aneurinibacillus aneurinilyticus]
MIHRDFCNPEFTKEYSALRMQFNFLLSRYTCQDGFVALSMKEMAEKLSCSIHSIYKFIRKGLREKSLAVYNNQLYLLRRVNHENYTEGYVKHFPFLESEAFQDMSLHAQRFVLYALWSGVHTGYHLKRALSDLYHSTKDYEGKLNIYTKKELKAALEEAATFLKLEITTVRGIEKVTVHGLQEEYARQSALENVGEYEWLDEQLVKLNAEDLVSKTARRDLLKLKSEYINRFAEAGKKMFVQSLEKLANSYKLLHKELTKEGEIGRYFRSILDELAEKALPFLQKQLITAKNALTTTQFLPMKQDTPEASTAEQWASWFRRRVEQLQLAIGWITHKQKQPAALASTGQALPAIDEFPFYNWLEAEDEDG